MYDQVLNACQGLVKELRASGRDKRPRRGSHDLLLKALQRMGQHAAGPSQRADISFHAMMLFCAVVPVNMQVLVTRILDHCFTQADPQVCLNFETSACKLSQCATCLMHTLT